ncbi:MAG: hypothetical protein AB7O24_17435 [Kofleriaceae bacterium]
MRDRETVEPALARDVLVGDSTHAHGGWMGPGALVSVLNWILAVSRFIAGSGSSVVPVFGAVIGFVGCALVSAIGWKLGLVALVLDPGCAAGLWVAPVLWVREVAYRRSRE